MTSNQAKALALHSVYRRADDAADFVAERLKAVLRHLAYMTDYQIEVMIEEWLHGTGYATNFAVECSNSDLNGHFRIQLLYRNAMLPQVYCGVTVGEISIFGELV